MKRKQYILIGILLFMLLVLLGPLVAFPKLQTKLENEIQGLESYKAIPVKTLKWQGRNAYLRVPEGTDTALIVNAMNDMKAVRGVRNVELSYGTGSVEPTASNESKEGRKLNRRVELTGLENSYEMVNRHINVIW